MPFIWVPNKDAEPLPAPPLAQQVIPLTAPILTWWNNKVDLMPRNPGYYIGSWSGTNCIASSRGKAITVDCTISIHKPRVKPGRKPAKDTNTENEVPEITKRGKRKILPKDKCYIPITSFQVAFCGEALLNYATTFRISMINENDPGPGLVEKAEDFMLTHKERGRLGQASQPGLTRASRALAGQNLEDMKDADLLGDP